MTDCLDWWRLRVKHKSLKVADAAGLLLSLGAQGAEEAVYESQPFQESLTSHVSASGTVEPSSLEIASDRQFSSPLRAASANPDQITSFWEARDFASTGALITLLEESGFTLLEFSIVNEENWVQSCLDHFEELHIGELNIIPISSSDAVKGKPRSKNNLWLIPGSGWGTGHHPSTSLALEILQSPFFVNNAEFNRESPKIEVLDMGTGSGILSIATIELYPSARVDAIDIDERALLNASENLSLNGALSQVNLSSQLASDITNKYDLILANIYAEVLVVLEPQLSAVAKPGCLIILSGIINPMLDLVKNGFSIDRWEQLNLVQQDEWVTILLKRVR